MISYTLKCEDGHRFESWFQSARAFDSLKAAGHLSCAICGCAQVDKAIMAPSVTTSRDKAARPALPPQTTAQTQPASAAAGGALPVADMPEELQAALKNLKTHVEANSDYVGGDFAKQARDMHLGDLPERPIYGEVAPKEARDLIDDGVPVMPLPFTPTKKAN